jgi:mannonate dehydratase
MNMKENRRDFIKKSASLAAAVSVAGLNACTSKSNVREVVDGPDGVGVGGSRGNREFVRDAGMQMSWAYFGGMNDQKVALAKQMDVLGAVGGLNARMVGMGDAKPWEPQVIKAVKEAWEKAGLKLRVIEGPPSLNVQTKLGLAGKDEEIENFITFMRNLKQYGDIDVICYNWMPVISWARTTMDRPGRGGALVTAFDNEDLQGRPLTEYGEVSKETLWSNLEYFLKAVVPEAEKIGMKLAMHPDDPQVDSIQGISRIMNTVENFDRMLNIVPSKYNGVTLCQGNFALMEGTDIPALIRRWGEKDLIHFVHFRNVRGGKYNFEETFHDEGMIDMHAAMQAYYDIGFKGPIRPDHVPTMAGDSNERPGYSTIGALYAFGYIRGLMESVSKAAAPLVKRA